MADEPGLTKKVEGETPKGAKPTPEPKGQGATAPTAGELPEEAKERTREQFEKLKDSNRQLFEANRKLQVELQKKLQAKETFAPIQQVEGQQTTAQAQQPIIEQFTETDPITGDRVINEDKLKKVLEDTQKGASQAAERAVQNYVRKQQAVDTERQTKEAYATYPELNPNNPEVFDKKLHRLTRATLTDSYMNPEDYGNFSLTFKEAAKLAKDMTTSEAKKIEKKVEKKTEEIKKKQDKAQEKKEQGSLEAKGVSGAQVPPPSASEEDRRLIMATRAGDFWALAKRLTRTPHAGTPTSEEAKGEPKA